MKLKLLPKFVLSLAVLGAVLTVVISFFSYNNSKGRLEQMYAHQVTTGCASIADMLSVEDVSAVIADGGEQSDAYVRLSELMNTLKKDGQITFLSLVVPDEDSVTFYIDAFVEELGDDPANVIPYGSDLLYTDVVSDDAEMQKYLMIWNLFSQNLGIKDPVITDNEYGYNYSSAAPILDESGKAIAEVQYIIDMQSVRDSLNHFLRTMIFISLAIIAAAMLVYIFFVRQTVTAPVGRLAAFTKEITASGNFKNQSISLKTGDEIEDLGNSFNYMLAELDNYIINLSKITAEKERIGAELDVATHIQKSMLPCIFPAFPNRPEFDIFASMQPAKEVGGDFYDFFMVDERHLAIVMADVSGKGVPAALFMVIGKTLIKDHTQPGRNLGDVFTEVNSLLCESNSEGLFVTAFEGVLDLVTGEFVFVNAGHEMPFIRKAGGSFEAYKIRPGFVLAGMDDMKYKSGSMFLDVGDRVFQYTDGVTEATNAHNELYGMERLKAVLNKYADKAPNELLPAIGADIDEFVGEAPQFDDITMLCLDYKAEMKI